EAIKAFGLLGNASPGGIYLLKNMMEGTDRELMISAAASMAAIGYCDDEVLNLLLMQLKTAIVRQSQYVGQLAIILKNLHDSPADIVTSYFKDDPELLRESMTLFH
ncbi:MAG: hypothetical protein AAGA30_09130, partial [Planctomycetota bacterium]